MTTMDNSTGPTATLLRYVGVLALLVTLGSAGWANASSAAEDSAVLVAVHSLGRGFHSMGDRSEAGSSSASNFTGPVAALPGHGFSASHSQGVFLDHSADHAGRMWCLSIFRLHLLQNRGALLAGPRSRKDQLYRIRTFLPLPSCCLCPCASGEAFSEPHLVAPSALFGRHRRDWVCCVPDHVAGCARRGGGNCVCICASLAPELALAAPVVVAGAGLLFMPRLFFERMQEATTSRISGRQDIWLVGIHSLQSYGAFGAGLDNFSRAYQRYAGTARFFAGDQRDAHNIYLSTAVEFGILGLLFLFKAVRSHLQAFPRPTKNSRPQPGS